MLDLEQTVELLRHAYGESTRRVRDLSRGGAGLSMPVRWPAETRFGLVVPSIRGVPRTLLYDISNIRPQRDGALLVGARLLEPHEFEETRQELLRLHPKEAAMPFDLAAELDRAVLPTKAL
ncbi:MAG TPA: PilZ domain-containing protein [Tepidisphaeraceae bacterium]|nr:PilZ domain-containing protein [Tepidisphaeraceae bacterium]